MLTKPKTPRDPKYLDFVRTFDCVDCGWPAQLGFIEAHHVYTGGMSIKCSDYDTVPLCGFNARGCHQKADKNQMDGERFAQRIAWLNEVWVKVRGHKLKL